MLISLSKFSLCRSYYPTRFKEGRIDKVYLQKTKICALQKRANPLIAKRIKNLQKQLIHLSGNSALFELLAVAHYVFFVRQIGDPQCRSFRCRDSAYAMIHLNVFDQKLYREVTNIEVFEGELQDSEEGAFYVGLAGDYFLSDSGEKSIFQGHAFIIFKMIDGNKTSYLIAQSFVAKYSLKSFILKNKMIYHSYDHLKKSVLEPLKTIINQNGKWSRKECYAHFKLTSINPSWLIGFSHPKNNLLEDVSFGRTSNIHVEGSKATSLGKLSGKKFEYPDEWKKIIQEAKERE